MQRQPNLTDRRALEAHRIRATSGGGLADFLQQEAAIEIQERLELVNKSFTEPAVVTGWPNLWSRFAPTNSIVADKETLNLAPGSCDLVIHAMSLHWANDPVGQLIQCRRALKPDGFFLAVFFGGQTLHELRAVLAEAEAATTGGLSPRIAPMAEIRDLGGLLQRAGFALPVADSQTLSVTYQDAFALMRDLRAMGEGNALAERQKTFTRRGVLELANARYYGAFPAEQGRIQATFELIFLAGWAPDDSQQQPLRPGSAQARLADALGVTEGNLDAGD